MLAQEKNKVFKSVDELIDHFIKNWKEKGVYKTDEEVCYSIIYFQPSMLLTALESKHNVPSVYDLILIRYIIEFNRKDFQHGKILKMYKNRKN